MPPTVGWVEEAGAESVLHVGADALDALVVHLIAVGYPFEVLAPPQLRDRLRELATALLAAHPPSPEDPASREDPASPEGPAQP